MPARQPLFFLLRLAVAGLCILIAARSAWMARADWLANGSIQDLDHAIRMEPRDGNLLALAAVYRSNNGDNSQAVDRDLNQALALNPSDSRALMTLGLRQEFSGHTAMAEASLTRAAAVDRQFRPAWTLAGFYFRHNRPADALPLLRRCLELDPLGYDPDPVFDLASRILEDPVRVEALIPARRPRLLQYLAYLTRRDNPGAVAGVWKAALATAEPSSKEDAALLIPLPAFFARNGNTSAAVESWNALAAKGILPPAPLDPRKGAVIADPVFAHGATAEPFGWAVSEPAGVFSSTVDSTLRFEFDGNQPEEFELLHTTAALIVGNTYTVRSRADGSALSTPADPGFRLLAVPQGSGSSLDCPLLTASSACRFSAGAATLARVAIMYKRAPGTTRPTGVLRVAEVALVPVP